MRKEVSERPVLSDKDVERLGKVFAKEPNTDDIPELDIATLSRMKRRKGTFLPGPLTKVVKETKAQRST